MQELRRMSCILPVWLINIKIQSTLNVPLPYALNYHFDNGVFRGLAFANYRLPEDAEVVVKEVNGFELSGRKLRVEYKRMLPQLTEQEREQRRKEKEEAFAERRYPTASKYLHDKDRQAKLNDSECHHISGDIPMFWLVYISGFSWSERPQRFETLRSNYCFQKRSQPNRIAVTDHFE